MAYGAPDWYRVTHHDVVLMVDTYVPANIDTGQIDVSDTAVQIKEYSAHRRAIVIKNIGTSDVYIGRSSVTVASGYPLAPSEPIAFSTKDEIWAVCETGKSSRIAYLEVYRS